MVSSSTISGDAGKIKEIFSDYSSQISTLSSGIWEGNSKENAVSQMQNFVSHEDYWGETNLLDCDIF